MLRGVKSWLRATIPRLASSASPKVGAGAEEPTRAASLLICVSFFCDSEACKRCELGIQLTSARYGVRLAGRGEWGRRHS